MTMNKDTMQGKWKQVAGKVKETWGKFTDDEITRIEGSEERLSGLVQERYGVTKEEAKEQVRRFMKQNPWN